MSDEDNMQELAQPCKSTEDLAQLAIANAQLTSQCPSCRCIVLGWHHDGCLTKKEYPL